MLSLTPLAGALFAGFGETGDLVRMTFLDAFARRFYVDWDLVAQATVASLRASTAFNPDDPRLLHVVEEVGAACPEFADLWHRQDVRGKRHERKRLDHPEVGRLELDYETFDVRSAPGQQLVVYHADPGSRSAQGLALLGTLTAPAAGPLPEGRPACHSTCSAATTAEARRCRSSLVLRSRRTLIRR